MKEDFSIVPITIIVFADTGRLLLSESFFPVTLSISCCIQDADLRINSKSAGSVQMIAELPGETISNKPGWNLSFITCCCACAEINRQTANGNSNSFPLHIFKD